MEQYYEEFETENGLALTIADPEFKEPLIVENHFDSGEQGLLDAVNKVVEAANAGGTIPLRYNMIARMVSMEARMPGTLVTGKGNGAISTIKREWGIKRNTRRWKTPHIMGAVMFLAHLRQKAAVRFE
tara:strand:- start:128 stop:511 length:384 start_codon:yes stop_codon:yes gene_type:complete